MKKIETTKAPRARSALVQRVAWLYVASLVIMAVGQLYSFEDFIPLIADYWLPGGKGTATLVAGLIVVTEVFALPFLLRMPLSPLMRWVSMACGVIAASIWVKLALWTILTDSALTNSGMLGVKVVVPAGLIAFAAATTLLVLSLWSTWGLWPARNSGK